MFCRKCGKEISNEAKFCPMCGENQGIKAQEFVVQETKVIVSNKTNKGTISLWLQIFLTPIMSMIREFTLETVSVKSDWAGVTKYEAIPDNVKVIMIVLLIAAVVFSFSCSGKIEVENKGKITAAKILAVVNFY